jgi:hypothetical protein
MISNFRLKGMNNAIYRKDALTELLARLRRGISSGTHGLNHLLIGP